MPHPIIKDEAIELGYQAAEEAICRLPLHLDVIS
jgi:hypothetical protein